MRILIILLILCVPCKLWATTDINLKITPSVVSSEDNSKNKQLPYYDQIIKILDSVEYSGFEVLKKQDVTLKIDYDKKTWMLQNIHQYDSNGELLLEQGRYGLCAELATYVYQKLKPLIKNAEEIKFAMATESGFFPAYEANHIVLLMIDPSTKGAYLIDPSFHKYGSIKDFKEYQVVAINDALSFVKNKSPDVSFLVDQAMPLFIKGDLLLSLSVTSVDGQWGRNNFLFVITASRRNKISGLNIVIAGKHNGQIESFEARDLLQQFLNPQDIENLHNKISMWMQQN